MSSSARRFTLSAAAGLLVGAGALWWHGRPDGANGPALPAPTDQVTPAVVRPLPTRGRYEDERHRVAAESLLFVEGMSRIPAIQPYVRQTVNRYYAGKVTRDSAYAELLSVLHRYAEQYPADVAMMAIQAHAEASDAARAAAQAGPGRVPTPLAGAPQGEAESAGTGSVPTAKATSTARSGPEPRP